MRKILLFTFTGVSYLSSVFATVPKPNNSFIKVDVSNKPTSMQNENSFNISSYNLSPNLGAGITYKSSANINFVEIGSSPNLFTALVSESNCLTANQELNTVAFIKRINSTQVKPKVDGSTGVIQASYSTNGGGTFDSTLTIVEDPTNAYLCRFPSGAIVNPKGNTNPDKAFAVVSGPWHPGSNFQGNYFGSINFDGSNNRKLFVDNLNLGTNQKSDFARNSAQSTDNGKMYVMGSLYKDINATTDAAIGYSGGVMHIGTLNETTKSFNWTTKTFPHTFKTDPDSGGVIASLAHCAWSQDGKVGYVIYLGEDSASFNSLRTIQPIVYKSIDAGLTWKFMPMFDFSKLSTLTDYLKSTVQGTKRPIFSSQNGIDFTVDANYNLHIATIISSIGSDNLQLDSVWSFPKLITDVFTTPNGWDAIVLDSLKTSEVLAKESTWTGNDGTGAVGNGWGARLQISRTQDGKRIFYGWMDTELSFGTPKNFFPDIFTKGYNVETGLLTNTVNVTSSTTAHGEIGWMYFQNITLKENSNYNLGFTTTASYDGSKDALKAVKHFYVKGASFSDADFSNKLNVECTPYTISATVLNSDTCERSKGKIKALVTGNTSKFMYSINGGLPTLKDTIANIKAGKNILTVVDTNNCVATTLFDMTDFGTAISASFVTKNASVCNVNDGSAVVTVLPADTSYQYSWSTSPATLNDTALGLKASTYDVLVTNSTGCAKKFSVSIASDDLPVISVTSTSTKCYRGMDGSASVSVISGKSPFTYLWDDGSKNTSVLSLSAGTYSVAVKDANGCTTSSLVTVNQPDRIEFTTNFTWSDAGKGTSSAEVSNPNGGTAPYTYSWNTTPVQTTQIATNLNNSNYIVTVKDANGCEVSKNANTVGITENSVSRLVNIYPNPTNNFINVDINSEFGKLVSVSVLNITGETIQTYSFNTSFINRIDLSSFSNGLYIVKINSDDKAVIAKVTKQ